MIGVSYAADLNMKGVKILGFFDSSLPSPSVPQFDKKLIEGLIEPAIIIAVTGFIESQSVTRTFGYKKGYFPDHNSELFALGFSNVIGAFLGCYASFGSLPRSRILFNNGGKTTVASFLSAVFVLIITLCLSEILKFLPKTTLAAIVFVAAFNLIEWGKLINICKHKSYGEIWMVLATFIINLLVNIQSAILLSLITGAIYIIKNSTVVDISLKGRIEDSLVVKFSDEDKDSSSRELQLKNRTSIVNSSKMSKNSVAPTVTKELAETTSKNENETVDKEDINGKQIYNKINKKKSYIYVNMDEYPEAEILGNFTICSINVPLLFYNCCKLRVEIERSRKRQARYFQKDTQYTENNTILLDFQNSKAIDGAAVSILKGLIRSYKLNKEKVVGTVAFTVGIAGVTKLEVDSFKDKF
ncbi:Solute carrier 26 [Lobulomyces angularis]|nr:Solute carrier 26 [Lobulomyces angularis]